MERAERVGLGVATAGHILLFGILSLGIVSTARLPPPRTEPIDVQLVDLIGLRAAAPQAAPEPPAPSEAPDEGPPEDAAPPPPDAVPPLPAPKPAEPAPAPPPKAMPEKPAVKPEPKPVVKPEPKPVPPKPAPKREPRPEPKPIPPKPQKDLRAEKAAAEKAAAAKAATARAAADKAAAKAAAAKTASDRAAAVKAAVEAATAQAKGNGAKGSKAKATGSRLGSDFLKGLKPDKATGKAAAPAAAVVDARAMAGLAGAIKRQVEPCYELGSLQGTDAMQIVTVLRLRFNKDGSTATAPTITEQTGVNADNRAYARQIGEVAKRAVLRCSPLRLPADLYDGGWEDIELRFTPGQMG